MLNKKGALFLLLSAASLTHAIRYDNESCRCEHNSKSYLRGIPTFSAAHPTYISAYRNENMDYRDDGRNIAIQGAIYGGKSQNSTDLASYFLPVCGDCIVATEELVGPNEKGDVQATHFNVFTVDGDFKSNVSFAPKQSIIGFGLSMMWGFAKKDDGRGWWFEASMPIERKKNDMNLCEKIIDNGGGVDSDADTLGDDKAVANMREAFKQKAWKYGKIGCKGNNDTSRTEAGVADIELRLGHQTVLTEDCHWESYAGIIAPTGNKPDPEFVWDPVVGNGKHFGIMVGSSAGYLLWENIEEDKEVRIEVASNARFLFENTQKRSFDLKNKPWSRYIELYENETQAEMADVDAGNPSINLATPGINIFTRDMKVRPNSAYTASTTLTYAKSNFKGELGYNFYAREQECVCLKKAWKEGPAIKADGGEGNTNPVRDIRPSQKLNIDQLDNALADYNNSLIKASDLDLKSAAAPGIIAHTVFGSLGGVWEDKKYPFFMNMGGLYQFSRNNNAVIDRWVVWGKFGISY